MKQIRLNDEILRDGDVWEPSKELQLDIHSFTYNFYNDFNLFKVLEDIRYIIIGSHRIEILSINCGVGDTFNRNKGLTKLTILYQSTEEINEVLFELCSEFDEKMPF
ncbi:hypothetical protein [Streptococcus catagoni]|uniref:hypothetical protein n=1 Tax=Streptococcus catagoni TaxID=2654874 RepID=UPI00140B387C|nr:hypothetical protein [Streptococcus catagoni]